ncbi:MAG TPA: hypothetical protein V6C58_23440 [Allocoleopsis sp.]
MYRNNLSSGGGCLGVIYIGDRSTGKTALVTELISPRKKFVNIPNQNYDVLRQSLFDGDMNKYKPTDIASGTIYHSKPLQVEVVLPGGPNTISVDWLDTPGETWQKSWQDQNPTEWRKLITSVQNSQGIMLILSPYREQIINCNKPDVNPDDFLTLQQWRTRFQRWVDFFQYDCPNVRHILLCLNKADLFCNPEQEARELQYDPDRSFRNWFERNNYVSQKFFYPVSAQIQAMNKTTGGRVRCFITTIYNRELLELPWLYLASHLL